MEASAKQEASNQCKDCEFGQITVDSQNLEIIVFKYMGDIIIVECLHWDRPENPFFIKATDPTPLDCPKEREKLK